MNTNQEVNFSTETVNNITEGFDHYINEFKKLTILAPEYFKTRNWREMQANHRKRLRLYKDLVKSCCDSIDVLKANKGENRAFWVEVKNQYTQAIKNRQDRELAETFYNSVIRKSIHQLAVDEELMYVHEGYDACDLHPNENLYYSYPSTWGLQKIIRQIVQDFDFGVPYYNKEEDIQLLVRAVREVILSRYETTKDTVTQVLKSVFYRNKAAYLIGRTRVGEKWMPFIIPFLHSENGIYVDTLIFDPKIMAHMFSFSRSYFMVEVDIPSQMVSFLNAVISHKQIHELYNAIGFNKHGKTEFYRDFLLHMEESSDQFEIAEGIKGMVMTVFTLPSYNIVFKLIKDHFEPPKDMTRQEVKEKYKLVSLHDRVGRMADTHEFEYFSLPLNRISPELIQELKNTVNSLLIFKEEKLIIKHLYTERKMTPLNIFLESCDHEDAKFAVEDYGNSILQLAQANIFPGDMMTKNFGVTRQKRVIFYDYDEIEFLTDMNFRWKPKPENYEQIYASSPWYDIARNDIFPVDFKRFMIGRKDVKDHFLQYHKDLFDPNHWKNIQHRITKGELLHAFPYPKEIRFRPSLTA
ncbi:bifunctional isocitrate dehydrogenase kinase/phosphatase [Belliella kenyensis]|uniref:Bifunctional isocitrate dehydrogenase kinase/phosphatase n=1 Tax=Belliella kenyensis TaxID=1472724 RepID=A0ABV8EQI8_9BACT|nr:bifunctional isocitrate dehydrogenase kinase/phosphatase [Belliella kenyensis]MCH7401961.1 bifunctional isocitrate dehydrogenase kinase/phosphatase [Belliella kenyensis]MDN3605125.1 bifunctional isocitrate dehydrogenase kinase/phosphatase [Belliella kenyensis]